MRIVSVLGAGRSSGYLIDYLADSAFNHQFQLNVYDTQFQSLWDSFPKHPHVNYLVRNVLDPQVLSEIVGESYVVVSLLPPAFHIQVAKKCLELNCHLATASYISPEMKLLKEQAKSKQLIFLNELGLDPGLDHISAHHAFKQIREMGGEITGFESYCGGLISQNDCIGNPWEYKITWNPMNVVLAGQGGDSLWLKNGETFKIDWKNLFSHSQRIEVPKLGNFDGYPNRDSLIYIESYGLFGVDTMLRGTLRRVGYCEAWNYLVQAGFTDNQTIIPQEIKTQRQWFQWLTNKNKLVDWLDDLVINENSIEKIHYLELDSDKILVGDNLTSAQILLEILKVKWLLGASDKDEVIMMHKIDFVLAGRKGVYSSVLNVLGQGGAHSAMAKTVGLPLAMGTELIVNEQIKEFGVIMPFNDTWANYIKIKLENYDIQFVDEIVWA